MDEPYAFEPDPAAGVLRIAMTGFWDRETVDRYEADRQAAIRRMEAAGCREANLRILVDRSSQAVQSQEVVDALMRLLDGQEQRTRRTAVVVGGFLQRRQAARISTTARTRFFQTREDAEAWLLGGETE